jgi:hypothetical protein
MNKLVYFGPSGLGQVTIHEGDFVEFSNGMKGVAIFSPQYSGGMPITYRWDEYDHYQLSNPDSCHSGSTTGLVKHIPVESRIRTRRGFGAFVHRIESS